MFSFSLRGLFTVLAASAALSLATQSYAITPEQEDAFAAPVGNIELDNSRGAFSPTFYNLSNLTASSDHNMVVGSVTGANMLNGSINNTSGLVNVIQNSGNNVIIQSSTVVNLSIH